jgi:hypothetical protein
MFYSKCSLCPFTASMQTSARSLIATRRRSQTSIILRNIWKPATILFRRVSTSSTADEFVTDCNCRHKCKSAERVARGPPIHRQGLRLRYLAGNEDVRGRLHAWNTAPAALYLTFCFWIVQETLRLTPPYDPFKAFISPSIVSTHFNSGCGASMCFVRCWNLMKQWPHTRVLQILE